MSFFERFVSVFQAMPPARRVAMLLVFAICAGGFAVTFFWANQPEYQVLFSNLSQEDAGKIVSRLSEQRTPYQLAQGGAAILIPTDKVYETRLLLATEGLPKGGTVGFEIFDNTKLGMTEFVHNINFQRALQGELSRTINGLEEIDSSRVHIVIPSKSLFIDKEESGTASVVVRLHPGRYLAQEQIQGIVHLVSSSVSGLSIDNVILVDNHGKMLSGFKDSDSISQTGYHQYELQETKEKALGS